MNRLILIILIIYTNSLGSTAFAQSDIRTRLVGSWIYWGFETPPGYPPLPKEEQEKAEKTSKGMIITFFSNGRYQIWHKVDGKKEVVASGETKLTNNDKHLSIEGLDGDIFTLNDKYLKFSRPESPYMVFKKYKE